MNEAAIFDSALDITDPSARAAFLDQACAGDDKLRRHLDELLAAQSKLGKFLDRTAGWSNATIDGENITERPGTMIGPYKLVEQIGVGGFGLVFVADQLEPVQRQVAVKVIKPGMDTREVMARFAAERQALALMDHPNIAKVLDAGTTVSGRPYFVMELVRGIPITNYCDENHLDPRQRLELFIAVCQAVQHAHQKGIIHRDIKPSNILVSSLDGKPVVKVIDFGVAKAVNPNLNERSFHTAIAQMVGTPLYMSPEQAAMRGLDIDTRSDIYSLGVLLYELLTGTTPFDKKQFARAAYDEIRRIIREEEPEKPSTRLSRSDSLPSVAAQRKMEPARLSKEIRGDLDWITMKALEKDRTRRYETASGLARDIERFLSDEPVEARPPSAEYRFRKFLRRNKAAAIAASLIILALLAGMTGIVWQAGRAEKARKLAVANEQRANEERDRAENEKAVAIAVRDFLQNDLLRQTNATEQADALKRIGRSSEDVKANPTIRELLDRAAAELAPNNIEQKFPEQPLVQAEILNTVGDAYRALGEYQSAIDHLRRSRTIYTAHLSADHLLTLMTVNRLALANKGAGNLSEAIRLYEQVRDIAIRTLPDDSFTFMIMHNLAAAYRSDGRLPEAIQLFEQARDGRIRICGPEHVSTLNTMENLAQTYRAAGKPIQAIQLLEKVRDVRLEKSGPNHPATLNTLNSLAAAYKFAGQLSQATALFEQVRDAQSQIYEADHPTFLTTLNNLASCYRDAGKLPDAIRLLEQVRDARIAKLGKNHPSTVITLQHLAAFFREAGRLPEAIQILEDVRVVSMQKPGPDHPNTLSVLHNLAGAYREAGRLPEAIQLSEQVHAGRVKKLGRDHLDTLTSLGQLAQSLQSADRLVEAEGKYIELLAQLQSKTTSLWIAYDVQSMLGEVMLAQKKHTDAEPNLIQGYDGLKKYMVNIPPADRDKRLSAAVDRLIKLYDSWGKPDEAAKWRKELKSHTVIRGN